MSCAITRPRDLPFPARTVPRTASPARKAIFNVGSPKDDHKSYFDSVAKSSSPRHSSSSASGSSTSDSEDDVQLPHFNRIRMNSREVDGLAAEWRERIDDQAEDITPRAQPANVQPANAAKERDSGFFELPSAPAPSQDATPTPDAPRGKPPALDLRGIRDVVPFPKGEGTDSPVYQVSVPFPKVDGPPSPHVLPRTPSTPIILSNGKALKSSLKSSASSPNFAPMHSRSRSAPTTPGGLIGSPTPR
ncbi:hypothetical protein BKA62DRAFT_774860 [Auriculariales sp. MPI-PUGE-AT-0066]|nr:hypothetical protein BKA62DRAFT_774860 [Auriculariales sp. MPI-PUGE-AT-0066]